MRQADKSMSDPDSNTFSLTRSLPARSLIWSGGEASRPARLVRNPRLVITTCMWTV